MSTYLIIYIDLRDLDTPELTGAKQLTFRPPGLFTCHGFRFSVSSDLFPGEIPAGL